MLRQGLFIILLTLLSAVRAQDGGWSELCDQIKGQQLAKLPWDQTTRWVNDTAVSNEAVLKSVERQDMAIKAFSAAVLLRRGFDQAALDQCMNQLNEANETFIYLFSKYGDHSVAQALEGVLKEQNPREKGIVFAKNLWQFHASDMARDWLLDHYEINDPADALVLAESGLVEETKHILNKIRHHPTAQGEHARRLLQEYLALIQFGGPNEKLLKENQVLYEEARTVLRGFVKEHRNIQFNEAGKRLLQRAYGILQREKRYRETFSQNYNDLRKGQMLLWEILLDVQQYYVDDERINPFKLIEAAARGITAALDRHSSYMGVEETRRSEERFSGNYVGIGAVVKKTPAGTVLIESVFFGAPAWKAGIRSSDQIIEVFGESVVGMTLDEAVSRLRGEPGTTAQVKVIRAGWDKPVDYDIVREAVNTPSLFVELLPGDIAYAKLTQFIATSDEDLIREILKLQKELQQKQRSLTGLILDLRDNGGGYLTTAVNICDQFLEEKSLIVYSEGRNKQIAPRDEIWSTGRGIFKELPLVVMVNKGSASASEIVSGCMRDHKRATVVGERTFGKGSVQNLIPLDSQGGEARLRLTIAYYYLPSGESIHRRPGKPGGVLPHVVVKEEEQTSDTVKELVRLHGANVYDDYINEQLRQNKELFHKLATEVTPDWTHYPGYEKWYEGLKTSLDKETVCKYLRIRVRSLVSEDLGHFLIADWYNDPQLQAAIANLAKKTGLELAKISSYGMLKESSSGTSTYLSQGERE